MLKPNFAQPFRFSVDDLEKMIDAGIFESHRGHIELIEGEFLQMSPASDRHDLMILRLTTWSGLQQTANKFEVGVQMGLRLRQTESMPEPDLFWIETGYGARPEIAVVPLVIEVAFSSLQYDTEDKTRLYALDGLSEYWVVDLTNDTVQVQTKPDGEHFTQLQVYSRGDQLSPLCLPEAKLDLEWLFR